MDNQTLIKELRRQAIDDDVGAVVCQPQARVDDYFRLALKVAAMPASAGALVEAAVRALRGEASTRSYVAWRKLFDLAEIMIQRQPLEPAVERMLTDQIRVALFDWRADQVDALLDVLLNASLWSSHKVDAASLLCKTAGAMLECHEAGSASDLDVGKVRLCGVGLLARMEAYAGWDKRQKAVLACVRGWMQPPDDKADVAHRLRPAMKLLRGLAGDQRPTTVILPVFREALLSTMDHPERGAQVLSTARALFESLEEPDAYKSLYHSALQLVVAAESTSEKPSERLQWVASCHPAGQEVRRVLDWLSGFAPAAGVSVGGTPWPQAFLSVCQANTETERKERCRDWGLRRIREVLAGHPELVPALAKSLAEVAGDPAPNLAEAQDLLAHAAGLAALDSGHVKALAQLPVLQPAAESAHAWCRVYDAVRGTLRSPDRAAWLRLALDLIKVSLTWDAAAVTETVTRLRTFTQLLLMTNPGCAKDAVTVMGGLGEIVNGSLLRACARRMPVWNSETVAELNAAGLGIDLRPSDILALR